MLTLIDVLSPEDAARLRDGLAEAPFRDGKRTAGAAARKVKSNLQADGSDERVRALAEFARRGLEAS